MPSKKISTKLGVDEDVEGFHMILDNTVNYASLQQK